MKNEYYKPVKAHKRLMDSIPELSYDGDLRLTQRKLAADLRELLGLNRMPVEKCPLNVRNIWERDSKYGKIEKIEFTTEESHDIPAYVAIPYDAKPPYTFFICLQGHSTGMHNSIAVEMQNETKEIEVAGDRDFAIGCMKQGIASICIEVRGLGECEDPHDSWTLPCHNPSLHALMLGRTLLGERIFDVDRTIDYLESRGDVSMDRIGVMGNSGGGTISMFAGGLLERVAYVMPSCCFASFKDSIMSLDHCMCNYVPRLLLYADCADIVALACPKPMIVVSGKDDDIFPIDSAKRSFEKVADIYKRSGAESLCKHVIGNEGHRFYADQAWAAMKEFLR